MTKTQIIQKISKVDDDMLEFHASKPKIDPYRLKKTELEELLASFESVEYKAMLLIMKVLAILDSHRRWVNR